jgi:hypothetical protein
LIWKSGFIDIMKTTLEVPDELYRRVKARAALRKRKIRDFVEEGLRMALEADERGLSYPKGPLAVMEEIRARPLHEPEAVERMMERALAARKANWRDEG